MLTNDVIRIEQRSYASPAASVRMLTDKLLTEADKQISNELSRSDDMELDRTRASKASGDVRTEADVMETDRFTTLEERVTELEKKFEMSPSGITKHVQNLRQEEAAFKSVLGRLDMLEKLRRE